MITYTRDQVFLLKGYSLSIFTFQRQYFLRFIDLMIYRISLKYHFPYLSFVEKGLNSYLLECDENALISNIDSLSVLELFRYFDFIQH